MCVWPVSGVVPGPAVGPVVLVLVSVGPGVPGFELFTGVIDQVSVGGRELGCPTPFSVPFVSM